MKKLLSAILAVGLILSTFTACGDSNITDEQASSQLIESIQYKDDKISFVIPKEYTETTEWNIMVYGRTETDGMGMSVHFFEEENIAKEWEQGKKYEIDIEKDNSYTELAFTLSLGDDIEKDVDLLSYISK